jgi:predicted acylesterase/phospholipase RssA
MATKIAKTGTITVNDIHDLVSTEFKGFKDSNILGLAEFYLKKIFGQTPINKVGMFKGDALYKKLVEITAGLKFKDLSDDFKLYITSTEILTGSLCVFSKEHTPNVLLADAVRASCGIQGAFTPFGIELKDCIGGIFLNNSYKQPYKKDNEDCIVLEDLLELYCIKDNTKLFFVDGGNNGNCRTDIGSNIKSEDSTMLAVSFTYNGKPEKVT